MSALLILAAHKSSGRSSDSDSSAVGTFPVFTSGLLPEHHPYSVGHVAELHRLPDSPVTLRRRTPEAAE
jgi:hypothetical protein